MDILGVKFKWPSQKQLLVMGVLVLLSLGILLYLTPHLHLTKTDVLEGVFASMGGSYASQIGCSFAHQKHIIIFCALIFTAMVLGKCLGAILF